MLFQWFTSFFLLLGKGKIESPLGTANFLDDWKTILESRFTASSVEQCMDSAGIMCNDFPAHCYPRKLSFNLFLPQLDAEVFSQKTLGS